MRWGEMRLSIRFTLLATLLLLTSSTYRLQATGYRQVFQFAWIGAWVCVSIPEFSFLLLPSRLSIHPRFSLSSSYLGQHAFFEAQSWVQLQQVIGELRIILPNSDH
jgi:hypothetical protein